MIGWIEMTSRSVAVEWNEAARMTLVRMTIPPGDRGNCTNCGGPAQFRYGWVRDERPDGPILGIRRGEFCGLDCYHAYAEEEA